MLGGKIDKRVRGSLRARADVRAGRGRVGGPQRRWIWLVAGAGLLGAILLTWALWPSAEVEPRAREYRDVTACLLTDGQGVSGVDAAPVWAAMQSASERTHGQVRYLAVAGDQTAANAQTFVGTLILGRCSVIVAPPGIAADAVLSVAAQHSQQKFVIVGEAPGTGANVTRVDVADVSNVVAETLGA